MDIHIGDYLRRLFPGLYSAGRSLASRSTLVPRNRALKNIPESSNTAPRPTITLFTVNGDLILRTSREDSEALDVDAISKLKEEEWLEVFSRCLPENTTWARSPDKELPDIVSDDLVAGKETAKIQDRSVHDRQSIPANSACGNDKSSKSRDQTAEASQSPHQRIQLKDTADLPIARTFSARAEAQGIKDNGIMIPERTSSQNPQSDEHDKKVQHGKAKAFDSSPIQQREPEISSTDVSGLQENQANQHEGQYLQQIEALRSHSHKLEQRVASMESEISELQGKIDNKNTLTTMIARAALQLSGHLYMQSKKAHEAEVQITEERKQTRHFKDQWQKVNDELISLKNDNTMFAVADSTIQSEYKELMHEIKNWTDMYCNERTYLTSKRRSVLEELEILSPNYSAFWNNWRLRSLLIQSFIMKLIMNSVLTFDETRGLHWASSGLEGPLRSLYSNVMKRLRFRPCKNPSDEQARLEEVQDFSLWKARTALLLEKTRAPTNRQVGDTTVARGSGLERHLKGLVQPEDRAWDELEEIFQHAIRLDEMLNKSRAIFSFEIQYYKFDYGENRLPFDERTMQTMDGYPEGKPGGSVDLVVFPGLVKMGNSAGERFDASTRLIKSRVVCREKKKSKSPKLSQH